MRKRHYLGVLALLATTAAAAATWQAASQPPSGSDAGTVEIAAAPAQTAATTTLSSILTAEPAASLISNVGVIRHDIAVTTVDSTAVQKNNSGTGVPNKHLVLVPQDAAARKGRLFLFVLGTNSSETKEQEIVYAGVQRGYHAITLAFPNYDAVATLCLGVADTECTAKVREEILTGVDLSTRITVLPKDSLETRLKKLLVYLNTTYPSEGWGSFLVSGNVDWSKISALGHSQGAGHVAYLAKRYALYRATMVSGVADKTLGGQTAPWLSRANITPIANQYGFSHTGDTVVPIATAEASWNAIGLNAYGARISVDGASAPYSGSHKLSTSVSIPAGTNVHLAMMDDDKLPRDASGTPVYLPVWNFTALP